MGEAGKSAMESLKNEVIAPLEREAEKLKDPVVLAALMHTAAAERENTNRLLKTIIEKLDARFSQMEARIERLEKSAAGQDRQEEVLLPSVDEQIMEFVKKQGHASAEEVRQKFGYKGKNAASARLNHLCGLGLLCKKQVGRIVVFCPAK
ncbi:MAG: hypothetical protein N3F07_03590 [Candidatus Micrarchaeota archaeon]|nr:hypothetical protein [Candidatus Micrarchaeota archaeon]